ncbi:tryptophan 7-halogenase [Hephaestia sp. GCM10023244]|uniref:tryptophan 7-halogenase n=1 Tax=unclassified Hephaestia TaxID=2631281 RepID=UPI0020770D4E|nr:tryptophan 7-halogenase [Hephaestia sp. MAHUQ-44]MCM8729542.1 tryptophan 7-halogenase [Hephaestia sp. MAHUQ-44]
MSDRAIRSIAILGGGIVGLSAACAFARALPATRVTLIATPPDPAALADRALATWPRTARFHAAIGLDEPGLLHHAGATHRLGTAFTGWSADGSGWLHSFGAHGPRAQANFHQHWLIAARAGDTTPFHAYAPAAALAVAGRMAPPSDDPASPLADVEYALRLDPPAYAAHLTGLARHLRVHIVAGVLAAIDRRDDGGVAALILADGQRIATDLFVDAGGPTAPILSSLDDGFEDWSAILPCDRLLIAEPGAPALGLVDERHAVDAGWWWLAPGRTHTAIGLAYAAALTPDDEAARVLAAETGARPHDRLALRPGRRPRAWIANVLAIGDAAIMLDPLAGISLALAQSAILRAIDLLPDATMPPTLLAEFNRRTADEAARARDFTAAHYLASGRRSGIFWRALDRCTRPDSLAITLDQFAGRGHLPHFEEDLAAPDDWRAILLGMGVRPARGDAAAQAMPPGARRAMLDTALDRARAAPGLALPYRDFYRGMIGVQPG